MNDYCLSTDFQRFPNDKRFYVERGFMFKFQANDDKEAKKIANSFIKSDEIVCACVLVRERTPESVNIYPITEVIAEWSGVKQFADGQ